MAEVAIGFIGGLIFLLVIQLLLAVLTTLYLEEREDGDEHFRKKADPAYGGKAGKGRTGAGAEIDQPEGRDRD